MAGLAHCPRRTAVLCLGHARPIPGSSAFSLLWGPLLSFSSSLLVFGGLSDCPPWVVVPS